MGKIGSNHDKMKKAEGRREDLKVFELQQLFSGLNFSLNDVTVFAAFPSDFPGCSRVSVCTWEFPWDTLRMLANVFFGLSSFYCYYGYLRGLRHFQ